MRPDGPLCDDFWGRGPASPTAGQPKTSKKGVGASIYMYIDTDKKEINKYAHPCMYAHAHTRTLAGTQTHTTQPPNGRPAYPRRYMTGPYILRVAAVYAKKNDEMIFH